MQAWRKGNEILRIIDKKRCILQLDIFNAGKRLSTIRYHLNENKKKFDILSRAINELTPTGLITSLEMYKIIREQGLLLSDREFIAHEIYQLEQDENLEIKSIEQYSIKINLIDKKMNKIDNHLKSMVKAYLHRRVNNEENETQEIAVHDR